MTEPTNPSMRTRYLPGVQAVCVPMGMVVHFRRVMVSTRMPFMSRTETTQPSSAGSEETSIITSSPRFTDVTDGFA